MFNDHSLLPKEAVRLAALGMVCESPRRYAALANAVRDFTSRIVGPSLDLLGSSIELLKTEGLIAGEDEGGALRITEAGRAHLQELLRSAVRAPNCDVGRLAFALKIRFLHHLPADEQRAQTDRMIETCDAEIARLGDLELEDRDDPGRFAGWLRHDIDLARSRRDWLESLRGTL
ncbi:MAG: hypothetical protein OXI22_22460 [Defluviicoccus sp.]|nr:hypothetical protein [Defluviicoccus sp.]MDE0386660.1 hypothetical protein [Defluviicoccus sp.]